MEMKKLPSALRDSNYPLFLSSLRDRVAHMFPENPSIKPIKFTAEKIEDQGIKFDIKLLHLLTQKPTSTKDTFSPLITKDN